MKTDTSINYIHEIPASRQSRTIQSVMGWIGMKHGIEKKMNRKSFSQDAAEVPKAFYRKYSVEVTRESGRRIWTIKPKQNVSEKVVLYLHGGAYIYNISKFHWNIIEDLLVKTNATIVVPDYPLSPKAQYQEVYQFTGSVYQDLLSSVPSDNIILMGDSAGAGLALGYAQKLRAGNVSQPSQLILISPWLDITMSNPEISKVEMKDKILGVKGLQMAGAAYAGDLDLKDPSVSPIFGDFSGLGRISLFIGTHDLFIADVRKLKDMLERENIPVNYFEYPKMFHAWVIITGLRESQNALNQMATLIINGG